MRFYFKKAYIFIILTFLLITLVYICDIENLPRNIVLFKGERLSLNTIYGIEIETVFSSNPNIERIENNNTITVNANAENIDEIECTGTVNLSVNFFGRKVKEINVDIIDNVKVVPIGKLIGVKLYTNGVLVVGMSEISGIDNIKYKPYESSGIEEGDVIVEIDENDITSTNELLKQINKSQGNNMNVKYVRNRGVSNNNNKCYKIQ